MGFSLEHSIGEASWFLHLMEYFLNRESYDINGNCYLYGDIFSPVPEWNKKIEFVERDWSCVKTRGNEELFKIGHFLLKLKYSIIIYYYILKKLFLLSPSTVF